MLASGGADQLVKVWLYDEGDCIAVGAGHSGAVTKVKISPDRRTVVSVGAEGGIFIWRMPSPK
jgi:WD40 repeat protein